MIWGRWLDPNFKFSAREKRGRVLNFFCYAESEDALRERLVAKNLEVLTIEEYDFNEWRKRAERAKRKAIDAYNAGKRPIKFNESLWAELKWHLFELFHGKCAYCESKPQAVSTGDVEHYRPKAKVSEDPVGPGESGHPGYYWLAYEITNLLPSCESCNRNFGKMNQFPVRGKHARDEASLPDEVPLLLNPYNRDINPFEHLEFNEFGEVLPCGNSPYGENSVKCYYLDRSDLSEPRRAAIQEVRQDWSTFLARLVGSGPEAVRQILLGELTLGRRAYSATQLWELDRITKSGGIGI